MLDHKITELARTMIQAELEGRRRELARDVERIQNEAAARGVGRSGAIVGQVYERCVHEIETRARVTWQILAKVLSTAGVTLTDDLAGELKAEVESYVPSDVQELTQLLSSVADRIGFGQFSPLTDTRAHALRKIGAEIDLFVLALKRRDEASEGQAIPVPSVLNFYSPVGVVQTGPGATAHVIQNLGGQDKEALVQALEHVRQDLIRVTEVAGFSRQEVVELVDDARTELEKSRPNGLRLTNILTGIATTIQTAGSLQPAYQALKAALLPLGIFLP